MNALSDVLVIMLRYHASGECLAACPWEDVSQYFIDEALEGDGGRIRRIRPHNQEHGKDE